MKPSTLLKTIWTKDVAGNQYQLSYETINPAKKGKYINYYSPVFAGTDSIIAIKTSLSDPPSFVLINPSEKTEKKIHIPGQMYPWFISYAKGKLVWVETRTDPQMGKQRIIPLLRSWISEPIRPPGCRGKSRYLSASVSPDGKIIAAVENTIR